MTKDQDISILQPVRGILDAYPQTVLEALLKDNSTGTNIIWADDEYEAYGDGYQATDEMTPDRLTGDKVGLIVPRIAKERERQSKRTRNKAEVFTPTWVCKKMIDWADEAWAEGFSADSNEPEWLVYVESPRLEITCGEAPFLVNRYDASSGEYVEPADRTGILGRKLELVNERAKDRGEWLDLASRALRSVYGYEHQGDNLLVARINILNSVADYARWAGYGSFEEEEALEFADIISWNLWQMDGLTNCVPYGKEKLELEQPTLFDGFFTNEEEDDANDVRGLARIKNWVTGDEIEFAQIKRKGESMKFDYIIGNPPYQEEARGANASDTPVYHYFFDESFQLADRVELISPARFLFNAGGTPKDWNSKMLSDPHNKVLYYEPESSRVFPGTSISGGVAVVLHDEKKDMGPIGTFTAYPKLNSIVAKVQDVGYSSLADVVSNRGLYRYSDLAYSESPDELALTADRRIAPSAFERMPRLFTAEKPEDGNRYVRIYGVQNGSRIYRWFRRDYVNPVENLDKWKVVVSKADGAAGQIGKPIPARICGRPTVLEPGVGFAETFISIGSVDSRGEAEAIAKYVKTKFMRAMLGVLKVTQNNAKPTWEKVPIQDFTSTSDIDWSLSVAEIDNQLYRKYGLSDDEIEFIETHVKEMS